MKYYLLYLLIVIVGGWFVAKYIQKQKDDEKAKEPFPPLEKPVVPAPITEEDLLTEAELIKLDPRWDMTKPQSTVTPPASQPQPPVEHHVLTEAELVALDDRWGMVLPRPKLPTTSPVPVKPVPAGNGADPGKGTWRPASNRVVFDPPMKSPWDLPGCVNGQSGPFTSGCKMETNPNMAGFSFAKGQILTIRMRTHADLSQTNLVNKIPYIRLASADGGNTSQDMYMWLSKDPLATWEDTPSNSKGGPPNMGIVIPLRSKDNPSKIPACELEPDTTYYLHIYKAKPQATGVKVDLISCMAGSGPQAIFKTYTQVYG